jgi:hypothetical protein
MWLVSKSFLAALACVPAFACTCVTAPNDVRTPMTEATVVFRGTVVGRKTLLRRIEMGQRDRFAITFLVDEFWKGSPTPTFTIYGMDSGTDCMGDGGYEVGKVYLVFATAREVRDIWVDGHFLFGWADLFSEGSRVLLPDTACTPGGEVSKVHRALRQLGKGKRPEQRTL